MQAAPRSAGPLSLTDIVENGLCIGCGLCRSIAEPGQIEMVMTPEGRERPVAGQPLSKPTLLRINAVCPGTRIDGPDPALASGSAASDAAWGSVERLRSGTPADPEVRFRGSSGGVLTALGQFLIRFRPRQIVLHVGASRSRRCAASGV